MKQTVLALAFVALAFASCKNPKEAPVKEETTAPATEQPTAEVTASSELVGIWTQPNQADTAIQQGFELKEDGTMVAVNDKSLLFSTWKVVDNTLVFESKLENTNTAAAKTSAFKYELVAGKTLKLDVDGTIEEFTKQ